MTVKLNLGCGRDVREGYVNVDLVSDPERGILGCDLSILPWPWKDNGVDEILMLDFLEHFPYRKTMDILAEAWRVLNPEGKIVVQVPDFEECSKAVNGRPGMLCNRCGFEFTKEYFLLKMFDWKCGSCGQSMSDISEAAVMRLYGGQDYPGNWHYTTFTQKILLEKMVETGFFPFELLETEHQRKNWNFKVSACRLSNAWGNDG